MISHINKELLAVSNFSVDANNCGDMTVNQ